jgi:predicted MFS family arabinose efflux permease
MTQTKQSNNWSAVWSLTIGVAGLIIAEFLPAGVLTPIAHELHITEGMAGQAVTATSVFAVITSLLIAYLTKNFNRRIVLLSLSFLLSFSSLIVAFAPNFLFLLVGRVILGISLGGFWSMATAITIRLVPENDVPKALALIFGGSSFASVLAAPLGSFLEGIIGWRDVFLFGSAVGLLAFMWQFITLPSLKPAGNTKLRTTIDVIKVPEFAVGLFAIAFVFCGRFATFTYLRPFLEQTTKVSANWVSTVLLVFGLSYFVGNWFAPGMIKRNIRSALFIPPIGLAIVSVGLLLLGQSLWPTIVLVFLWGAFFGPVAPAWSTWVAKKVPEYAETGGGLYVASVQFAAAVGAFVGGFAFDFSGSSGVFILSGVSWALSALLVYRKITVPQASKPQVTGALPILAK